MLSDASFILLFVVRGEGCREGFHGVDALRAGDAAVLEPRDDGRRQRLHAHGPVHERDAQRSRRIEHLTREHLCVKFS